MDKTKNILVVVRHPLGGIRTYMKYMFRYFPDNYKLTLIAASTQENDAILGDVSIYGAKVLLINNASLIKLTFIAFRELFSSKYHLILSQGFISATIVYFANMLFRIPHILTIHGILESRLLVGSFAAFKRFIVCRVIRNATVLYGVSNDILNHVFDQVPGLKDDGPKSVVIPNGVEGADFLIKSPNIIKLRETYNIDQSAFLFGFFGRFMPQKGFDLLINAVDTLGREAGLRPFKVVAAGSGDYIRELQQEIRDLGIEERFIFMPFQPQAYQFYCQLDAIVMPSRWEASGLLAMEALCMGTPLIASDCIGLRETIAETPAMVFPSEDLSALVTLMRRCLNDNRFEEFNSFKPHAIERFSVVNSARQLISLIEEEAL